MKPEELKVGDIVKVMNFCTAFTMNGPESSWTECVTRIKQICIEPINKSGVDSVGINPVLFNGRYIQELRCSHSFDNIIEVLSSNTETNIGPGNIP